MKMRKFGKLGIEGSAYGIGCMRFPMIEVDGKRVVDQKLADKIIHTAIENGVNYFDTAYVYSDRVNEEALGKALEGGWRERVYVATKLPPWNCETPEDLPKLLDIQLNALRTDYIDFYLVHSLNKAVWEKMKNLGVREFLDKAKKDGKIKYACFSFHDSYEVFEEIINDYDWDMCQIQFNYLNENDQAGIKGLRLAGEKGIAVVIMEGLLGGKLANVPPEVQKVFDEYPVKHSPAEWAFKWICNHKEVSTVLSGVTDNAQNLDNIRIFSDVEPDSMTEDDIKLMDRAREAYLARIKVGCTHCNYCMPCPSGVDIPAIFATWNHAFHFGDTVKGDYGYNQVLKAQGKGADKCIGCGSCEAICPQHINIIDMLKQADTELSN